MDKKQLIITAVLLIISLAAMPFAYKLAGPALDAHALSVLKKLLTVMGCAVLLCFVTGEITSNNSQVDKLWSILPAVYAWIVAANYGLTPRLIIMAVLVTLWACRLTFNFGRKNGYHWKFWQGEEDYRWTLLRNKKMFQPRWKWTLFDLFFICFYQHSIILIFTLPILVAAQLGGPLGWMDIVAGVLMFGFLCYETIADEQHWAFQSKKWAMIRSGKKLEELPAPYNKGFLDSGLWALSRHPNYWAEQSIWASFYLFTIAAGGAIINWSFAGVILLIVLFLGSSIFGEGLTAGKYPLYAEYQKKVRRYFPIPKKK